MLAPPSIIAATLLAFTITAIVISILGIVRCYLMMAVAWLPSSRAKLKALLTHEHAAKYVS